MRRRTRPSAGSSPSCSVPVRLQDGRGPTPRLTGLLACPAAGEPQAQGPAGIGLPAAVARPQILEAVARASATEDVTIALVGSARVHAAFQLAVGGDAEFV